MDIIIVITLVLILAAVVFLITRKTVDNSHLQDALEEERNKISELEKKVAAKEVEINIHQQSIEIANTKLTSFEQIKLEKTQFQERLKLI